MTLNAFLGLGTLGIELAAAAIFAALLLERRVEVAALLVQLARRAAIPLAFFVTLAAMAFSLYHSEVVEIVPCGLCWVQRIFIYAQVPMFLVAWIRRDVGVWVHSIVLSVLGGAVALYQHYLQMGGGSLLPCPAAPGAADCAQRILFELGYITYPLMAFSVFVFLIALMLALRRVQNRLS